MMKLFKFVCSLIVFSFLLTACGTVAHPGISSTRNRSAKDGKLIAKRQDRLMTTRHKKARVKKSYIVFNSRKKGGSANNRRHNR